MTKIQLKRSSVLENGSAKEPLLSQTEYGELCVNYNTDDPAIFIRDSNDQIIRIAGAGSTSSGDVPSGGTNERPTSPNVGDIFYDTTIDQLLYWNGSEWVAITGQPPAEGGEPATIYVKLDDDGTKQVIKSAGLGISNGTDENITLTSEGNIELFSNANAGIELRKRFGVGQDTDRAVLVRNLALDETASIKHDGSATFAGNKVNIDGDGRLLVGTTSSTGFEKLVIQGQVTADAGGAIVSIRRGEAAADIASNQGIGNINFADNAGGQFASINIQADAAAGSNNYPGRILFQTTGNGASVPSERMRIDSSGNALIGGTLPDNPNISLKADGSATFAGSVQSINYNGAGQQPGYSLATTGALILNRSANEAALRIFTEGSGSALPSINLNANGSATFAGSVTTSANENEKTILYPTGGIFVKNAADYPTSVFTVSSTTYGTPIEFNSDGSASFAGTVQVGGNAPQAGEYGVKIYDNGSISVSKAASSTTPVFDSTDQNALSRATIFSDGSAKFTGDIKNSTFDTAADSGTGYQLGTTGTITAQRNTGYASTSNLFAGYYGATPTFEVFAGGSATFAGAVQSGGNPFNGTASGTLIGSSGLIQVSKVAGESVFTAFTTGTSSPTINFTSGGNATFAGALTAASVNGASVVLTSDTEDDIDVRERLETKTAALEAIKVAAEDANITTLADFKAAIATALASYA